jgi:hypothetical protein
MEVFDLLKLCDRQFKLPFSEVRFENFTGIELEDFAVETAKLSLYIAQHQMNVVFEQRFAVAPPALPLRDAGRIIQGNPVYTQEIPFTDFPLDEVKLYFANNVIHLPSEY